MCISREVQLEKQGSNEQKTSFASLNEFEVTASEAQMHSALQPWMVAAMLVQCASVASFVGQLRPLPIPRQASATSAQIHSWSGRRVRRALVDGNDSAGSASVQPPRHPIYWIDECEPHDKTRETAARSARNLPLFLANKGIAPYNVEAFEEALAAYAAYCTKQNKRTDEVPLLLDSCCGTGRSTWNLAKVRPDAFIIGVDKSIARLERNAAFREKTRCARICTEPDTIKLCFFVPAYAYECCVKFGH